MLLFTGGSRCLVLITVGLGLICVLLLVFIILQHITITAKRDLIKSYNTVKEFNQTINSLQDNYTDLMTEKHQLQNNFSSLSQKKLELETRVKDLTAEKSQLQNNFSSLSQKKLELETRVKDLTAEKSQLQSNFNSLSWLFMSSELKSWSDSRQYCRDRGADLVIINTEEKQSRCQDEGKARKQRGSRCLVLITVGLGLICVLLLVFIILQHITITAERDLIKSYKNTVEEFDQTINSLQDNYTDLMTEKHQLQNNFSSLSQKKLELESKVTSLSEELNMDASKRGWFFMSNELKSWSDSRQYCRDRGGDLVIINTEEKQRLISSFTTESVWIGLSDTENEGNMTWVDNSPMKQGFWVEGEPNNHGGYEDCIELNAADPILSNWNDLSCNYTRNGICEKY
ncbi:hypothetical protein G5714_000246 [Onychostoma macrolepis]|uniref:C-type lectin domain-containing protein n=1 Tax=Onychostoma macrolepis TaxID=369639 RepID=A0A7J6DGV4_9TELE|nr:hypothetical protein G5714_000246 [Onychostoma macrolepis]